MNGNLQVLYFSKKNKEIKNLENGEKFVARYRHLDILLLLSQKSSIKYIWHGSKYTSQPQT